MTRESKLILHGSISGIFEIVRAFAQGLCLERQQLGVVAFGKRRSGDGDRRDGVRDGAEESPAEFWSWRQRA